MFAIQKVRRAICLGLVLVLAGEALASDVILSYAGRYWRQFDFGKPDEIVGVEYIGDDLALVSSNTGVRLIDLLDATDGTPVHDPLDASPLLDTYTSNTRPDGYSYVNLRQAGFAVCYVDRAAKTLTYLKTVEEPGVYFEKMAIVGDLLYVTAHAYGLRIYDLTDPANPTLKSSLSSGFDDAFAVAVAGNLAYVADGAGGLKIVDVSDPSAPTHVAGENPTTAVGTAQDVLIHDGKVYLAVGGDGVAVYSLGTTSGRQVFDTPGQAKHLARAGDYLGCADVSGCYVFEIQPDGTLVPAAAEKAQYGTWGFVPRVWGGIHNWGDSRFLTSNWYTVDIFEVTEPNSALPPDITLSTQRVRFNPAGGTASVTVMNTGASILDISDNPFRDAVAVDSAAFKLSDLPAFLLPGESALLTITYDGGQPADNDVLFQSNDPDEIDHRIQVAGDTIFLDPGEPAIDFTLDQWTFDHDTRTYDIEPFTLSDQLGKVVYFQIYGSWCPACMTVASDIQNTIVKEFEGDPRVYTAIMNQAESSTVIQETWQNFYLRGNLLWDPTGAVAAHQYGQPRPGLPFGRGFIIDSNGIVARADFGHNPAGFIAEIYRLLAEMSEPGDLNCDGVVDTYDIDGFVAAVTSEAAYATAQPHCRHDLADVNEDGVVDTYDIDAFVALMAP